MTTREEAEALRRDERHWTWYVFYSCREDPRPIVRNRWFFGWTWNLSHPRVLVTMLAFILVAVGPAMLLLSRGVMDIAPVLIAMAISFATVIGAAHYIASGPRDE